MKKENTNTDNLYDLIMRNDLSTHEIDEKDKTKTISSIKEKMDSFITTTTKELDVYYDEVESVIRNKIGEFFENSVDQHHEKLCSTYGSEKVEEVRNTIFNNIFFQLRF